MSEYVLVTPAKNEAANLPAVIASVVSQTLRPEIWLILDDGSTDKTSLILQQTAQNYPWVRIMHLLPHPRDITFHYAYVCKTGFDEIMRFCIVNDINYRYIGLLDADTEVSNRYFETLINAMEEDVSLGIVSGGIYHRVDGVPVWNKSSEGLPAGTGRLWKKECFIETRGYPIEPSPDSISNIKAMKCGWNIRKFKSVIAIERRTTSGAEGLWHGYKMRGKTSYYFNKNPLGVLLNCVYFTVQKPHYTGAAYLYGYIHDFLKRGRQIEDEEIKHYYRREHPIWIVPK